MRRRLAASDGELGSALPKMAIAGVQHHGVPLLSRGHPAVAGGGGAAAAAVPLPNVHFERPRRAPAQEEGADFIVIVAPKQQQATKRRGFRDPEHPLGMDGCWYSPSIVLDDASVVGGLDGGKNKHVGKCFPGTNRRGGY